MSEKNYGEVCVIDGKILEKSRQKYCSKKCNDRMIHIRYWMARKGYPLDVFNDDIYREWLYSRPNHFSGDVLMFPPEIRELILEYRTLGLSYKEIVKNMKKFKIKIDLVYDICNGLI